MKRLCLTVGALVCVHVAATAAQQRREKPPELTGTVAFEVTSKSGIVQNLMFTVGDGGSGPQKAAPVGDETPPTHAICRPRDLSTCGGNRRLPVVAWANGGWGNTSGEFLNVLTEVASHGFMVVAIGPAAYAIALGSEQPTGGTRTSQFFDGLAWAAAENDRADSPYYRKLDPATFAIMGQSCGGVQTLDGLSDPRVKTAMVWNSGVLGTGRGARTGTPPPTTPVSPGSAPVPPVAARAGGAEMNMPAVTPESLAGVRIPVAIVIGGPSDLAFAPGKATCEALATGPVLLANRDVGHYPATYREPHGGAFAAVAVAWLTWQLSGDKAAQSSVVGKACGLCTDAKWTVEKENID